MKKTSSLILAYSLIVLTISIIVAVITPQWNIASWADWHFLGLNEYQWARLHVGVGYLFLITAVIHMYLHRKSIAMYCHKEFNKVRRFNQANVIALIITLIFVISSIFDLPPVRPIMTFSSWVKERQSHNYGEPPFEHAEFANIRKVSQMLGVEEQEVFKALQSAGIVVHNRQDSLKQIAHENHHKPKDVYAIIVDYKFTHPQIQAVMTAR